MADYFVSITASNVSVKEGAFFAEQGGLREPWGKHWEKIDATSLYDARAQGIKMRRKRFPDSHQTLGENEPMEEAWPEAKGI